MGRDKDLEGTWWVRALLYGETQIGVAARWLYVGPKSVTLGPVERL